MPTRLWLATDGRRSAGMLLQRLPESEPGRRESEDDDWDRLLALAGTLRDEELLGLGHGALLGRLFAEDDVRLFDEQPVAFSCSCDRERVANTLRLLGRDEIGQLVAERGEVEVRCEFCNHPYRFDAVDAEALFADTPPCEGSTTLH